MKTPVKGISWGRAFRYALSYVAYVVIWWVVGGALVWAGISLISSSYINLWIANVPFAGFSRTVNFESLVIGIAVEIIGIMIIVLGNIATFFKLMSRLIEESVDKTLKSNTPTKG